MNVTEFKQTKFCFFVAQTDKTTVERIQLLSNMTVN